MAKLSSLAGTIPRRVLITGMPGSGKTTLAASLASRFQLDWFDVENGVETLLKLPEEQQDNVNLFRIPDDAAYPIAAETLMKVFKNKKGKICHVHGKDACMICAKVEGAVISEIDYTQGYPNSRCVVVDTGTQVGMSILANITRNKPVDYKPERDDWGALRKHTDFFASQWQNFPGNLIVVAHLMESAGVDGRTKLVPSFGSAGMSAMFAKAFSHVIYCEVVNKTHRAYSSSTYSNNVVTKSRTGYEIEKQTELTLLPLFESIDIDYEAPQIPQLTVIEGSATRVEEGNNKQDKAPATNALAALQAKYGLKKT